MKVYKKKSTLVDVIVRIDMASPDIGSKVEDYEEEFDSEITVQPCETPVASDKHVYPKEEMIIKDGKGYINGNSDAFEQFYRPSTRTDVSICIVRKEGYKEKEMYGKWMAFRNFDELDVAWKEVVSAMKENRLKDCWVTKCTTLYYNPSSVGPGPVVAGLITAHTSKDDMQAVGSQFIHIVKQDIKYKLDTATLNDEYAYKGHKMKLLSLYYNAGIPSRKCEVKCPGLVLNKEDIWHINEVSNPKHCHLGQEISHWIVPVENTELTYMWHKIKQEMLKENIRAFKMICPSTKKTQSPSFQLYVTEEEVESVGRNLIAIVRRDITLKRDNSLSPVVKHWENS